MSSTPKRSLLNSDAAPSKVIHLDRDQDQDQGQTKHTHERPTADSKSSTKPRSTESSRVGTSNSDLPLHRPMEQIKPVIKSVSDGHVPKPDTSKTPKLTLFNRDYSKMPISKERTRSIDDDDDDYSVSFVKPKAKTSTLFSGSKNRDQQSKLQMMLSFLRGDESKDVVDSVQSGKVVDDKKSNEKDEPKVIVSSSPSANLSTSTSVTFSTATTTSLLNAPTDAIKTSPIEIKSPIKETQEASKEPEKIPAPSSIGLVPITSTPPTILPVSAPQSSVSNAPTKTVTFNFSPSAPATTAPISLNQTTSTSSDSVPRLGGFCFSATTPSFTLPAVAKPTAIATTTGNSSVSQSSTESPKPTPTPAISFGLPQSTGATSTLLGTPVFGSTNALAKPTTNPLSLQSNQTTPAAPTFSFGSPATKPTLASSANVGFGALSSNTTASTATSSIGTGAPSMFTFGAATNTTNPAASATFGSNIPTTSPPAFGFNSSAVSAPATTTSLPTLNQPKPSFSFGNTANANKPGNFVFLIFLFTSFQSFCFTKLYQKMFLLIFPETSAFQFGNTTSTKTPMMTFGSTAAATTTTASAMPMFGSMNTANANVNTAATPSTFTFTPNKPATETKPLQFGTPTATTTQSTGLGAFSSPTPTFGQVNSAAPPPPYGQTPSFGSITNTPTTTASTPSLFGNASSPQNTSIFGQQSNNSTPSALPKIENSFGMPSNQSSTAPVFGGNQNQTSAFGSGMNAPAFGATGNNVFGNTPVTQNQSTFGSGNSLFSTPTTTQSNNNAFGSSGVFSFGQNAAQTPANTTSQGIFGSPSTNTTASAPFVFGQSNNNAATQNQASGIPPNMFGAKPAADGLNANAALSAPPSFGGSSPAFNFSAAKPNTGFSFNASNPPAANVPAFGSSSTPPQFGSTNGLGTVFSIWSIQFISLLN